MSVRRRRSCIAAASGISGFTLLEMVTAVSVASILMAAVFAVYTTAMQRTAYARARSELARDGGFAAYVLTHELRQAGLGVPKGAHIAPSDIGATDALNSSFHSVVIVQAPDAVGVVGDFPKPHTSYGTFGLLHNRVPTIAPRRSLAWHNENNGACMPPGCSTSESSTFFPGEKGCETSSGQDDRTCPWGLQRLSPGDPIAIVAATGEWTHAFTLNKFEMQKGPGAQAPWTLTLAADWPSAWPNDKNFNPANGNEGAAPAGLKGVGWVTTLDRVFFRKNGDVLERRQCWGVPVPGAANWPNANTLDLPADPTALGKFSNRCSPWEPLARNVEKFSLEYSDRLGAPSTKKATTTHVSFRLRLRKPVYRSSAHL